MNAPANSAEVSLATFRRGLVFLLLLGLIIRAGFLVEHARSPSFGVPTLDQKYYDTVARLLLSGEDLRQLHGFRPLLYPMFLAACYKIGGAHGIDLAIVAQHFIGVLTGLLVAILGAGIFRNRLCGLVGGALYLLAPIPLAFEGELLIEPLYVFLICAGLWLIFRAVNTADWKGGLLWAMCGAWIMLTAQARPNICAFMIVLPLFAAWQWRRTRKPAALAPLLALFGAMAMALPWGFVNKMQSGHFQALPSGGGVNLYLGNKRTADGMVPEQERRVTYGDHYEDSGEVWAREEYAASMRAKGETPSADPMAVSRYWTGRAFAEIESAPAAWLGLMAKKSWLMLWNAEVPNNKAFAFLQTEFLWLRLLPVRWVALLMLAPAGIWLATRRGNRDALFILLVFIGVYAAGDIAFFVCDRYRYPIWPAMAVLAGGGLSAMAEIIRLRKFGLVSIMVLMAALSLPNWFGAKLPSFARDYLFRSIAWYEKGHFAEALQDVDRSLALDPGEVTALHHRGNVLLALSRFDEARADYERTLKVDTDDDGIWNDYGIALDGVGRTNDALAAYRHATECKPPSKSAFLGMAFDQIRTGHPDDAGATLSQLESQEKSPNAVILALRSVLARRAGNAAQAAALESQARAIDSASAAWAIEHANKN